MSRILYGVGAFAVVAGVLMIGFGAPVNEFSFGNTLIGGGVTALIGGLIVIGLGAVVAELHHLGEALALRPPVRPGRPLDLVENAAGARPGPAPTRIPFPPRPTVDAGTRDLRPPEPQADVPPHVEPPAQPPRDAAFAPMLRNPEEAPMVEEDVSLSPPHPMAAPRGPAPAVEPPRADHEEVDGDKYFDPKLDWGAPPPPASPPRQAQPTYFDAMWPADQKQPKTPAPVDTKAETKPSAPPKRAELDPAPPGPPVEPRGGIAILKAGMVDGMGYTLYVDGSIEAELPQGTLRFSSINELRSHLEKNS